VLDREEMGMTQFEASILDAWKSVEMIANILSQESNTTIRLQEQPTLRETIDKVWPQW